MRTASRRLQLRAFMLRLWSVGFSLVGLRLLIATLKTPDYLTAVLVALFSRHLIDPPK